jgi:hypothetical protein
VTRLRMAWRKKGDLRRTIAHFVKGAKHEATVEVIGVMPPNFRYPTTDLDLLAPLFIPPDEIRTFGHFYRADSAYRSPPR